MAEQGSLVDGLRERSVVELQVGNTYSLAVFHADRRTDQSHFKMVTSIDCFLIE